MPNIIHSEPYRNWVRGALGLLYVHDGLYPFTDSVVKAEHARIIQNLTLCTSCTVKNIQPAHSGSACIYDPRKKAKCNCRQKANTVCKSNTCSQLYDEIIANHRFKDPLWVTDASIWYKDHWQIAKCFMTTTTQDSNNTAAETDAAGLLNIIINGMFFEKEIKSSIDPKLKKDPFHLVREIRNKILHNSTVELKDTEVTSYLKDMIAVLEDLKTQTDPLVQAAIKAAVKKLKEIVKDELVITTKEEARAIQTALDAIKKAKEQAEKDITDLAEEKKQELETAKETAVGEVRSTVAEYEPEVKLKLDDHEKRLKALEDKVSEINEKQKNMEKQVDLLSKTEDKHQTRMDYLKQKLDLQHHLVELYQKHYVKTWLSPLMTQYNNVNISEVYVSPNMVVEEKDDKDRNKPKEIPIDEAGLMHRNTNKVPEKSAHVKQLGHINRYQDMFRSRDGKNKRIYIIGDVGTGKSSFCKMMMENWCRAITRKSENRESDNMTIENQEPDDDDNIRDISAFELLFYVPLQFMSGKSDDIAEMIKMILPDKSTLIEKIFSVESESCLILADGLDEWTPSKGSESRLPHETYGFPTTCLMHSATVITTSRPSARGILDMQASECDLKVNIFGVIKWKTMIEKYTALLGKSSLVNVLYQKLINLNLGVLQNTPMLLQQVTWMYCHGYQIDKSITYIYTHIVNIMIKWMCKSSEERLVRNTCSLIRGLSLPKVFKEYSTCQENQDLIILLGKVAYDIFVAEDVSSIVLDRYRLKQLGMTEQGISALVQVGMLHEVKCADQIYKQSQFSFIHTSYMEFFAAVYISSYYLSQTQTDPLRTSQHTLIEDFIQGKTSAAELLRLENVLIMVCGLLPFRTDHILECICQVAYKDDHLVKCRREEQCQPKSLVVSMISTIDYQRISPLTEQIQDTCFRCLSESNSTDQQLQLNANLCDFLIDTRGRLAMCLSSVKSVIFCTIFGMHLSHDLCTSLSSFLSQAVSLESLELNNVRCNQAGCDGHSIDFSRHERLQRLKLQGNEPIFLFTDSNLKMFDISFCLLSKLEGNEQMALSTAPNLKICEISNCWLSHEQCVSLSSILSQAVSLESIDLSDITCKQAGCDGHIIDLSRLERLQKLMFANTKISVSGSITAPNLKSCEIRNCWLSHEQCVSLSSFLSQAVSLESLELNNVRCNQAGCDGHSIDFSRHERLQRLKLQGNEPIFLFTGSNLKMFEISFCLLSKLEGNEQIALSTAPNLKICEISKCWLSHEQCVSLSSILSQAVLLESIDLSYITCKQAGCDGHIIDLSRLERLQKLMFANTKISVSGSITAPNLKSCEIRDCWLSHEQCVSLSSFLSKAVSLESIDLKSVTCNQAGCDGHIIDLSQHERLQKLMFVKTQISVSGSITAPNLQSCEISDCGLSHEQCVSLSSFLSKAVSLESLDLKSVTCKQAGCDGHIIDLSRLERLQKLMFVKTQISVSGSITALNLQSCEISDCGLSHEQCVSLSLFLSQAVSLESLDLKSVTCKQAGCDGHIIDLSRHERLQKLMFVKTQISVSGSITALNLQSCEISDCWLSHEQCVSLSSFLSKAVSLESLVLKSVTCKQAGCDGHIIDLSRHERLLELTFIKTQISVSGSITALNLQSCVISDYRLSHEQCVSLSSFLSQAVLLEFIFLKDVTCKQAGCDGHIIDLSRHEMLDHTYGLIELGEHFSCFGWDCYS